MHFFTQLLLFHPEPGPTGPTKTQNQCKPTRSQLQKHRCPVGSSHKWVKIGQNNPKKLSLPPASPKKAP